ncbi:MAG TPA: SUMF1/EgtB/PvdO family nonheme iron enzyme [Verrucomicrobiae bacterium]|nr:SUMF1/EgtB/PvdO family nonheme iron enzyme [Verrucomicrobiae bacterium]
MTVLPLVATAQIGAHAGDKTAAIPFDQIGSIAGRRYNGDGLAVTPTEDGARLRCVFQKLEGQATNEGLWLTSTEKASPGTRFRVIARAIGRGSAAQAALPAGGIVTTQGGVARFVRPGVDEEYSVSMDGLRQDFLILERPTGDGELRLELDVAGARAEPLTHGARLVLDGSGRKIAYSRLRATDAQGRDLPARIEVDSASRLTVIVDDADATYPLRIDPTFSDADWVSMGLDSSICGTDDYVTAAVVDAWGNLYIGGSFGCVGDVVANRVAKWDGTSWSALGSGMGGWHVYALAVSGSNVYAGGAFWTAGGSPANHIARWDGANWSALGSGIMGYSVTALAVSGSDVYAGGHFTTAGGSPANDIAKWDGANWSALGSGIMGYSVNALAVSGSNVYAGGWFTNAGGVAANGVARWDGAAWSALGSGVDELIYALAVSGGNVYAGGLFTNAGGNPAKNIARWDGTNWSALGSGMHHGVCALAVSGSDVYAGGWFTNAGGVVANRIAKWDGTNWSALGLGIMDYEVNALAVSGSNVYAGGWFETAGGSPAKNVAKWNGVDWLALAPGISGEVNALVASGTDLYVGGHFTTAGGSPANNIAKWDGTNWSALGSGIYGWVSALAASGSNVYAGGWFGSAGEVAANSVAKWDGANWSALGSGVDDWVNALAVSGTNLYAGGRFTTAGGSPANNIAKWDGSAWSALSTGVDDWVNALAVSGSDVYAGGYFTNAGGVGANHIAKWDGSAWSALGSGLDGGGVTALAVSGSNVYAGGWFETAGGSPANDIAKWDGANWSALGSGFSVAVDALVVRGSHVYVGSVNMGYIGEWDGVEWSGLGSGVDHGVNALAISGSNLYVGGSFGTAGGKFSPCVAKANLPSGPEITVQDQWPWGWDVIADGTAWEDFDEEWVGASNTLTFTVHNTGTKNLTGLSVGKDGDNSGAFTVGALGAVELAPGENTTFDVTFAPSASGEHTAVIHIWSNDEDENPFDIALAGTGVVPVANVMVWQRVGTKVFDVYYDLAGTNLPLTIAVEVSTNNGASYELDVGGFSGELGVGVAPGAGRHVVWDAGTDWDGRFSPTMRFRITACEPAPEGFGLIPPRVFQMGDGFSEGGVGELPVHAACVGGFCMGATEVTKAQWDEVRAWGSTNGYTDLPEGGGKGPEHPVHTLSWYEALKWCNARSEKEGLNPCYAVGGATYRAGTNEPACDWEADGYRLPTEAEWEKAARGGVAGRRFPFGDTISHTQANYFAVTNGVPSYDVSPTPRYHPDFSKAGEIKPYTGPVTNFSANGCGLYGMADNVWEWCWDYYGADYYAISPLTDPHGPASGLKRLARGGCWDSGADSCRTAFRNNRAADEAVHYNGLRVARKAAIASESSNTLAADTRGDGLLPAAEDFDGDGCSNGEESLAGTDPRDPRSRFEVAEWSAAPNAGGTGITCSVMWASVEGRVYRLERSFDLLHWETIADDIDPTPPQNFINDEIIPAPAKVFYRMVVK